MKPNVDKILSIVRKATAALLIGCAATSAVASDFTVVIDAGHGGKDIGAPGLVTNEKTINLNVALRLGDMLKKELDGVKVVYTRSSDVFVPLQGRADIANKAGGDLFVSIHTNSVDKKSKNRTTVNGASVYTLGFLKSEENLAVAMRENAVMKLESDYTTSYEGFDPTSTESYIIFEMSQNNYMEHSIRAADAVQRQLVRTAGRADHGVRQANFWVLFKTSMPSMLVELDFICNPVQELFMHSPEGAERLARAIFNGIKEYKYGVDREKSAMAGKALPETSKPTTKSEAKAEPTPKPKAEPAPKPKAEPAPKPKAEPKAEAKTEAKKPTDYFTIQFMLSSKKFADGNAVFKGLSPVEYYVDGGSYKYIYGCYGSKAEAAADIKKVKALFPDAFIIHLVDGKRQIN